MGPIIDPERQAILASSVRRESSVSNALSGIAVTALPLVIDNIIFYGASFVDGIFIGQLGVDAIAALRLVTAIRQFFVIPPDSVFYALQPIIESERDLHPLQVGVYARSASYFSLIFDLLVIPLLLVSPLVLKSFNEPGIDLISSFFLYYFASVPAKFIVRIINQVLLSTRQSCLLIPVNLVSTVLGVTLSYLFVSVFHKGIKGLGIAATIQAWGMILGILSVSGCFRAARNYISHYGFLQRLDCETVSHAMWRIFKIGGPICLQTAIVIGASFSLSLIAGRHEDVVALASYHVSSVMLNLAVLLLDPLSSSLSVLLPNETSHNRNLLIKVCFSIVAIFSLIFILSALFFSDELVKLHLPASSEREKVIKQCRVVVPIMSLGGPLYGVKSILNGIMRSNERTSAPMLFDLAGTLIVTLILALLSDEFFDSDDRVSALSASQIIGMFVTTVGLALYVRNTALPPPPPRHGGSTDSSSDDGLSMVDMVPVSVEQSPAEADENSPCG